ncbi:unnamed protein product [Phytomonas sp. EM1]|nr:unnamed protein product [Phytomonas sp. EM1]|eukprot:CCW64740.1 unnamed protein product [Phytomonas sp. isolate EM1]
MRRMSPFTRFLSFGMLIGFAEMGVEIVIIVMTSSELNLLGVTVASATVLTGILFNHLLYVKLGKLNVHPIQILPYLFFISFCVSIPISFYSLDEDTFVYPTLGAKLLILGSSILSAFVNILSFSTISLFNPFTNSILWTSKMLSITFLIAPMFEDSISSTTIVGIILTVISIWWCSFVSRRGEK